MSTLLIFLLSLSYCYVSAGEKTVGSELCQLEVKKQKKCEEINHFKTLPFDLTPPIILGVANTLDFKAIHNLQYVDKWWYNACGFYREGGTTATFKRLWEEWKGYNNIHKLGEWKNHPLQKNNISLYCYLDEKFFAIYHDFFALSSAYSYEKLLVQVNALANYTHLNPKIRVSNRETILAFPLMLQNIKYQARTGTAFSFYASWTKLLERGCEYGMRELIPQSEVRSYVIRSIIQYDSTVGSTILIRLLNKMKNDLTKKNINYFNYYRYLSNIGFLINVENPNGFLINDENCLKLKIFPEIFRNLCILLTRNEERMWQKEPTRTLLPFLEGCNCINKPHLLAQFRYIITEVKRIFDNCRIRGLENEVQPEIGNHVSEHYRIIGFTGWKNNRESWIQCYKCKKFALYQVDTINWLELFPI